MACSLPNSMRSNSVTLGTHENEFRNDGSSAARLFEHLPKHALAWRRSPSNLPCSLTATGSFCCLNRETASRSYGAETCVALLRWVLRLGHARTSQLTGQRLKEKLWLLRGRILAGSQRLHCVYSSHWTLFHAPPWLITEADRGSGFESRCVRTGATPFLFWLSLYGWRLAWSPNTQCLASNVGTPTQLETVLVLSRGSFCFLLCLFSFTFSFSPSIPKSSSPLSYG